MLDLKNPTLQEFIKFHLGLELLPYQQRIIDNIENGSLLKAEGHNVINPRRCGKSTYFKWKQQYDDYKLRMLYN